MCLAARQTFLDYIKSLFPSCKLHAPSLRSSLTQKSWQDEQAFSKSKPPTEIGHQTILNK